MVIKFLWLGYNQNNAPSGDSFCMKTRIFLKIHSFVQIKHKLGSQSCTLMSSLCNCQATFNHLGAIQYYKDLSVVIVMSMI